MKIKGLLLSPEFLLILVRECMRRVSLSNVSVEISTRIASGRIVLYSNTAVLTTSQCREGYRSAVSDASKRVVAVALLEGVHIA